MKTSVIITEFNPLHYGHEYFIRTVRERSHADFLVAIMSGDFVQRGEPAIFNKYARARSALLAGADLVLELPVRYSLGNAGCFASGASAIMNAIGCADELWFGSESGRIGDFTGLASLLADEPEAYRCLLSGELKKGLSYPAARASAVEKFAGPDYASILSGPNNVLGLEYCLAAVRTGSSVSLHTIRREGSGYNETQPGSGYSSASAVRTAYFNGGIAAISSLVPSSTCELAASEPGGLAADDFSMILRYCILQETRESLTAYQEVTPDLARRIKNLENAFSSFTDFAMKVKTRNITYTHVCRALFSILLKIKKETAAPLFTRVLGMKDCGPLIRRIVSSGRIRLVSQAAELNSALYSEDLFASDLYESVKALKFNVPFVQECERKFIRL